MPSKKSSQSSGNSKAPGGRATVNVFDGTRQFYSDKPQILLTVRDGNQKQVHRDFHKESSVMFDGLQLFNNFGDNYTFLAFADGYNQAGFFPVHLAANVDAVVDLMLIPESNAFNFANATWKALGAARPALKALLAQGAASDKDAATRYGDIMEDDEGVVLACLLNITTAMQQINLSQGTPLQYLKQVIWDRDPSKSQFIMAQDRFFAWADVELIHQLDMAVQQKNPNFTPAPFGLHPGATRSYKQISFGEANVQLTFHEGEKQKIGGVDCVVVEPDIDYFKDTGAHLILEVLVNAFGSLTDPRQVYVLRWIAGRRAGIPEFDPLYTIQKA
jgi:hypothetical protein